jgi:hypothetical protein
MHMHVVNFKFKLIYFDTKGNIMKTPIYKTSSGDLLNQCYV